MSRVNSGLILTGLEDRERPLPETRKLALTENFYWVAAGCLLVVQVVPLAVAWVASAILR